MDAGHSAGIAGAVLTDGSSSSHQSSYFPRERERKKESRGQSDAIISAVLLMWQYYLSVFSLSLPLLDLIAKEENGSLTVKSSTAFPKVMDHFAVAVVKKEQKEADAS